MIARKGLKQQSFSLGSFMILFLLWIVLILSAFSVIYVTYDTRVKFNSLEKLRREQNQLQVVWGQYLLEESTWASYGRVETLAREKLSMQIPDSEKIIVVTP